MLLLYHLHLREDRFVKTDDDIKLHFNFDDAYCSNCVKCVKYCPTRCIDPENKFVDLKNCVDCQYCYFVCPHLRINISGEEGFLKYLISKYKHLSSNFS